VLTQPARFSETCGLSMAEYCKLQLPLTMQLMLRILKVFHAFLSPMQLLHQPPSQSSSDLGHLLQSLPILWIALADGFLVSQGKSSCRKR